MAPHTPRFAFSRPVCLQPPRPNRTAATQVFGSEAVDAGDVAAALRDLGIIVDSRCNSSSMHVWLCELGCSTDA